MIILKREGLLHICISSRWVPLILALRRSILPWCRRDTGSPQLTAIRLVTVRSYNDAEKSDL